MKEIEIRFVGIEKPVNVCLQTIKEYVQNDIKSAYGDNVTNEIIYEAFKKNPEYYLTKLYFKDEELDVFENNAILHFIVSTFFSWLHEEKPACYYVLKDGHALGKFDTNDAARIYAHQVGGYVMNANKQ